MGGAGRGVLFPMSSGVRREFHNIGFLEIICGWRFDPVASLVAYSLSFEVDWAWLELINVGTPINSWQVMYTMSLNGDYGRKRVIAMVCLSRTNVESVYVVHLCTCTNI